MLSFSQRQGLKPVKQLIQAESMDVDLRTGLWNALREQLWDVTQLNDIEKLCKLIWKNYLKRPIDEYAYPYLDADECPRNVSITDIKEYFFECSWNEVYDFLEFVVENFPYSDDFLEEFINGCNNVLEKECSAYRFVYREITQITSKIEIDEIEGALSNSSSLKLVQTHLSTALSLLSDRSNPDYRNSIKESISAVESLSKVITGDSKASLGQALKILDNTLQLHPALKDAFNKLYGYTSDADGIRHSLMSESDLSFEDAKFMLVVCSAFTNYLIAKSSKAGIEL